jgi:hypothetical protein
MSGQHDKKAEPSLTLPSLLETGSGDKTCNCCKYYQYNEADNATDYTDR